MVRDLDFPVKVVSVPTVREADGLAMSSRNTYLTDSDRETALCLSQALRAGAAAAARGPVGDPPGRPGGAGARAVGPDRLPRPRRTRTTLEDVPEWYRGEALLAVAGRVGTTRLIDNLPISVGPAGGALEVFSDVDSAGA